MERKVLEAGLSVADLVVGRELRAALRVLQDGSPVSVCGRPRVEVDGSSASGGYREPPTRVLIEPPPRLPLIVADCHRSRLLEELPLRLGASL